MNTQKQNEVTMPDYLQQLCDLSTEITIKPHNPNVADSEVCVHAGIAIKRPDGKYQYAKLYGGGKTVQAAIGDCIKMANALKDSCNG
jgi:hypothetical protein